MSDDKRQTDARWYTPLRKGMNRLRERMNRLRERANWLRERANWLRERVSLQNKWMPFILFFVWAVFIFWAMLIPGSFQETTLTWLCANNECSGKEWRMSQIEVAMALLGGGVAIFALWVAYRRAKAMEQTAKAQLETSKAQSDNAEAAHNANEQKIYTEAVTNLGNSRSTSARLGGIYGLFDLAKAKPERRENITEILCAHLRETTQQSDYPEQNATKPSNEIQSLLDVLCKLNTLNLSDESTANIRLNLQRAYLKGSQLRKHDLREANLCNAHLQGARLGGAQLLCANLGRAQLLGARLGGAQLLGANLGRAQLLGAYLGEAQLLGANLSRAQLLGADLSGAQLQEADLRWADLRGAVAAKVSELYEFLREGISLEERIQLRVGKGAELKTAVFSGGLTQEQIDEIRKELKHLTAGSLIRSRSFGDDLCDKLEQYHMGEADYNLPTGAGVLTSVLTRAQADEIIADYRKATEPPQ